MRWLVALCVRHYGAVTALTLMALVLGCFGALHSPLDVFPEFVPSQVDIQTEAPGFAPQQVEQLVTKPVENAVNGAAGLATMRSESIPGLSVVTITFEDGIDVHVARQGISERLSELGSSLPAGVGTPKLSPLVSSTMDLEKIGLLSDSVDAYELRDAANWIIKPRLLAVPGVAHVLVFGGAVRQIQVLPDMQKLSSFGITLADVSDAVRAALPLRGAGFIDVPAQRILLKSPTPEPDVTAISQAMVSVRGGTPILLRDVAQISVGAGLRSGDALVMGKPGVMMSLASQYGANTLTATLAVEKTLADLEPALKARGIKLYVGLHRPANFIERALKDLKQSLMIAAILILVVLYLFLRDFRAALIAFTAIPLSLLAAVAVLNRMGQTLNTMTLGGFALAIGILVDNGTVVIENIERHVAMNEPLYQSIVVGASEVAIPTFLSTLCICIVFVPVFLLQGTAKYLFSPLSLSVIGALLASLALSFTMVPVLFNHLMRKSVHAYETEPAHRPVGAHRPSGNPFLRIQAAFERKFEAFRESYRNILAWTLSESKMTVIAFGLLIVVSALLFPLLGRDFFPQVDAGQMRLHVRAPPGTRIERTQEYFAEVEAQIRQTIGSKQIDVMLDNIGLPYSGINIALSDSATVGPMDGEILISLTKKHLPTAKLIADLRRTLPAQFAELQFFFQPADIVDQVLNFGQPAPIDVRISGPDQEAAFGLASEIARAMSRVPGVVDSHVFQVPNAPALTVDLDRALATEEGVTQQEAANNVLVATNSSAQTAPNFWVDPRNSVSYPLVVQVPTYSFASSQDLQTMPVTSGGASGQNQLLMNLASFGREAVPMVTSQLNIRPVFDVHADVQGRDLDSAARDIDEVLAAHRHDASKALKVTLSGQVDTMRESYTGLFTGIALAIILVYLFLVMNFQSWIDPLIVLMAVPFALGGVLWMLFLTRTPMSVPALMGTLMCIGLTTANSILVVSFANQRMDAGDDPLLAAASAGYTRLRPVLMTASAMILGMVPMALGIGEGGEQNAPLGRAVIGGLLFATFATLIFVPTMYRLLRRRPTPATDPSLIGSANAPA